ncbi:hypothetical protein Gogos_002438 [Gossypium gossypioides]|uniref:Myb/SANT-like DNA-binding domain-containing protein n=1 Tax=Gossypium gossypioides TaxID=34282 RepID=A0A7J9CRG2_GOSGO|nr:hypothetical protein [Gossypium gossypioides]
MEGNPVSDDNLIQGDGSFQVHERLNPQFYQFQDVMKEIGKSCDDNWNNFDEEGGGGCDGCYDGGCKGKGEFLWRRVKWTVQMVKLLINAVCYIDEDASSDCQGVIAYRLKDKFNDLNKRYKRLNDVLGKGTSCKVVEKPELLDVMDVSDKVKEEVKKILSSKNLFYEEMCLYHTGNRLYLPQDPKLQCSLQSRQYNGDDEFEKELHDAEPDDVFRKGNDVSLNGMEYGKSSAYGLQEQWMAFRLLELQKQKLQIQAIVTNFEHKPVVSCVFCVTCKPSADGNMLQEWEYGCLGQQGSIQPQNEQQPCMSKLPSAFGSVENERREITVIEDDVTNYAKQCMLEHNETGKNEDGPPWQRMKWTRKMVKLLITILSYIGEDPSTDCAGNQIKVSSLLRKLGKWKCVSKVMLERGYIVSPQQCEDKFNNLNKTYRRLNDLLGRGTSCKVVENPKLLDIINVSEKGKEDVRKLLMSKHLFFEEMCSYHNGNRLYLPHDPDLLQSLLFILKNEDDYELLDSNQPVPDKKAGVTDKDNEDFAEFSAKWLELISENGIAPSGSNQTLNAQGDATEYNGANSGFSAEISTMWFKPMNDNEVVGPMSSLKPSCFNQIPDTEDNEADASQWMTHRAYQLEKRKLRLKSKVLDLEKQRLKWRRRSWKKDMELEKMRLVNKCLKHGNECIALQLKGKKIGS